MTLAQTEPKSLKIGTIDVKKVYVWRGRLPSEYQEVERIRSSENGPYIDTGMANISTATKLEYSYIPYTQNQGIIFMDTTWASNGIGNGWNYYYYGSGNTSWSRYFTSNAVGSRSTIVLSNTECSKNGGDTVAPGISSLTTPGTILLFANKRGGVLDGTPGRDCALYYYKRWESGTLVQDFVPCYRKADTEIGMYDLVNGVFYTNAGSGTFTKGNDVLPTEIQVRPTGGLPSAYQEVEYIESSGTQYFIVGTSFKTSYKSVIDLEMIVIGGDYIPLGVHNDAGKRYGIDAYGGKFTVISGGGSWTNTATEDTNRHLITIDKTTATVDGTDYSILYSDYTYEKGVGVFGYHNTQTNGVNYKSSNKLYKLDIYDENGTQIYDLVPCYRKSDTVIGMYDIINDVFYTNEGTGTFAKGNDVN